LPLLQKQVTQGSQVGQNSAAGGHVLTQFHSFSGDKLEGFLLAFQAVAFRPCFWPHHLLKKYVYAGPLVKKTKQGFFLY
jgi:hypothetical protein